MGTKTSATHVHSEIHRVGGDIGNVVRDFCGCVSCSSGLHNEKTINSVENDTVAPEVIICNLTPKLLILNNWIPNQEKSLFFS